MERHIPRPGEMYMDLKKKPYQILCVASCVKTKEKMVVYQALYGEFECFVRPLGIFMEEADHRKYPDASQKYRFELSDGKKHQKQENVKTADAREKPYQTKLTDTDPVRLGTAAYENCRRNENEQANPALLQFLDADTLEQKYQIIKSLGNSITNRLIDDFAVTLDLVIPDGEVDIRYQQLLSSVRTLQKFETTRFRKR